MLENCLSDLTYIKNVLDNETEPRFFDREFSFFGGMPALLYLQADGRIIYIDPSFTEQLAYAPGDIEAGKYGLADLFCSREEYERFNASVQQEKGPADVMYCLLSGDGEKRSYHITSRWLYKDCYSFSLHSVADEPAVKNNELDEFAYVASHDLQEPLRKITTFIQRLEQKLGDAADEDIRLYIKRINVSAANMRNLIDSLLEFSRVGRNKEPAGRVDLSLVLAETIAALGPQVEISGAVFNKELLPVVEAVPSQMQQLFHNLLDNAIKFRKPDIAPVINITSREVTGDEKKEFRLSKDRAYCMITATDNGIGFDPSYAEKIFRLFQRLHGKHEYPGAGMGLGICRKIIANNGGHIFAGSVPGEGSSFYIILPKPFSADV